MGWIWREKPDGSRALAYPVYLGAALAALALIGALHSRLSPAVVAARAGGGGRGADVGSITAAAAVAAPVTEGRARVEPAARSYRLRPKAGAAAPAAPSGGSFDAIDAALKPPAAAPELNEVRRGPAFPALPPAFEGDSAPRGAVVSYRDPSADAPGAPARGAPPAAAAALPRGALIPVILLTAVDTSEPGAVLQFAVGDDVLQHGRCLLRLGTHLLGKLTGRPLRGRLQLAADTVLFADGTQHAIAAAAVEADDGGADIHPGVAAEFHPPPAWVQTVPYVSELASGFLGLLQSQAQQRFAVGPAGLTLQSSVPAELQGAAGQAGAQALTDFTRARLKEMEERYAPYYLIPAGTACWMQLDADFAVALP